MTEQQRWLHLLVYLGDSRNARTVPADSHPEETVRQTDRQGEKGSMTWAGKIDMRDNLRPLQAQEDQTEDRAGVSEPTSSVLVPRWTEGRMTSPDVWGV